MEHSVNTHDTTTRIYKLSRAENRCVSLYLKGKGTAEISEELHISKRTVEWHISKIKTKLNCKNLIQLGFEISNLFKNM